MTTCFLSSLLLQFISAWADSDKHISAKDKEEINRRVGGPDDSLPFWHSFLDVACAKGDLLVSITVCYEMFLLFIILHLYECTVPVTYCVCGELF